MCNVFPITRSSGKSVRFFLFSIILVALVALLSGSAGGLRDVAAQGGNEPTIVGGEEAEPGEWPWQVALVEKGSDLYQNQFCGGTLIADVWVVTAAHCVTKDGIPIPIGDFDIIAGIHDLSNPEADIQRRTLVEMIVHSGWNHTSYDNDIALLKLSSPINERPEGPDTLPIEYADLAPENVGELVGEDVTVTGWGNRAANPPGGNDYPSRLHEVVVPVVSNTDCNAAYGGSITANMLCAGYLLGGKDSCQGDSGGPLVYNNAGTWQLAGVVSFGRGCAAPGVPGVYARVSRYVPWIQSWTEVSNGVRLCSTGEGGQTDCWEFEVGVYDDLSALNLNDQVQSVIVPADRSVKLFREAALRGTSECYSDNKNPLPVDEPWNLRGQVSSFQVFSQTGCPTSELSSVVLYESTGFGGHRWGVGHEAGRFTMNELGPNGSTSFNDTAESIRIPPGWSVKLYEHADGTGQVSACLMGDVADLGDLKNIVSMAEIFLAPNCLSEPPTYDAYLPSVMYQPTPPPPTCANAVANPSFEENASWQINANEFPAAYWWGFGHTGVRSMRIGINYANDNRYSYSSIEQAVHIPSPLVSAKLGYWLYPQTSEPVAALTPPAVVPTSSQERAKLSDDAQMVLLLHGQGQQTVLRFMRQNPEQWVYYEDDLSAFRGQTVRLYFGVFNDGWGGITAMWADDVTVNVCR